MLYFNRYIGGIQFMSDKQKQSEKVAEKNYDPNKKNNDKDLEKVHEQVNDTLTQGTVDEKEKQKTKVRRINSKSLPISIWEAFIIMKF